MAGVNLFIIYIYVCGINNPLKRRRRKNTMKLDERKSGINIIDNYTHIDNITLLFYGIRN